MSRDVALQRDISARHLASEAKYRDVACSEMLLARFRPAKTSRHVACRSEGTSSHKQKPAQVCSEFAPFLAHFFAELSDEISRQGVDRVGSDTSDPTPSCSPYRHTWLDAVTKCCCGWHLVPRRDRLCRQTCLRLRVRTLSSWSIEYKTGSFRRRVSCRAAAAALTGAAT